MSLTQEKKKFFIQLKTQFVSEYNSEFPLFDTSPKHLKLVSRIMPHYSTKHSEAQVIMSLNNLYYKIKRKKAVDRYEGMKKC